MADKLHGSTVISLFYMLLNSNAFICMSYARQQWVMSILLLQKILVTVYSMSIYSSATNSAQQTSKFYFGEEAQHPVPTCFRVDLLKLEQVPHFSCLRLHFLTEILQNHRYLLTYFIKKIQVFMQRTNTKYIYLFLQVSASNL